MERFPLRNPILFVYLKQLVFSPLVTGTRHIIDTFTLAKAISLECRVFAVPANVPTSAYWLLCKAITTTFDVLCLNFKFLCYYLAQGAFVSFVCLPDCMSVCLSACLSVCLCRKISQKVTNCNNSLIRAMRKVALSRWPSFICSLAHC